jgi:hypothetical protein
MSDDRVLLRAFEPVVRYTQGELFFPAAVEPYLAACDLWVGSSQRDRRPVLPVGAVTPERIAAASAPPGQQLFLRLVQDPLVGLALARWRQRPDRPRFSSPGRLARVGLFARLVDAGFDASLLLRGSVPGGTAAAAQVKYAAALERDRRFVYHGRVIREGGWIVLHYLYFYWMNDWRSSFFGANDHEADLEQAFVVLEDRGEEPPVPVWFGCAAHDYTGAELRRRWDDPTLVKVGDHPVIHAGAGSHAAYFEAGEYLTTIPISAIRRLRGGFTGLRTLWRDILGQEDPGDLAARVEGALAIPFIDYARGDGFAIGAGGNDEWIPVLVDDSTPWVDGYRGLWGLDTRDRFGGERAPAGLKYTRSGTVRMSWNDPLAFLGLWKEAPPGRLPVVLRDQIASVEAERAALGAEIAALAGPLPGHHAAAVALSRDGAFAREAEAATAAVNADEARLKELADRAAALADTVTAARAELTRVEAGDLGDPRAHLHHPHRPDPPEDRRYGMVVQAWSAISASLVLIVIALLLWSGVFPVWFAFGVAIAGYVGLEALFRRRFVGLLLNVTVGLAIVAAVVLAFLYWPLVLFAAVLGIAALTIVENVREVTGR